MVSSTNLTETKNDTWRFLLSEIKDGFGNAVDITGKTIRFTVKELTDSASNDERKHTSSLTSKQYSSTLEAV